jgi:protein-S-isoprenylcysteine O-methyltransferase Ste14
VNPEIFRNPWSAESAMAVAIWCWLVLGIVWLLMRFFIKRTKQRESPAEFAEHAIPAIAGFWLIFETDRTWPPLQGRLFPGIPAIWNLGLALVVAGVLIGIWARLALGRNWSGTVTLKDDHKLIGSGPYRWIRHPIYTGILLAALGSAIIRGHLQQMLGFAILLLGFYFKARREERFLRQEFGTGFTEHFRRTGMFLPKLSSGN